MIPGQFPDAYQAKEEKEKEALGVLFPDEKQMKERIKLITTIKGVAPDLYDLYLAFAEWEILSAMEENRPVNWVIIDPVKFLTEYAPSIGGKHADRAVEIARAAPVHSETQTFWERLVGEKQ